MSRRGVKRKKGPQARRDGAEVHAARPWRPRPLHSYSRRPLRCRSCAHRTWLWRLPPPHTHIQPMQRTPDQGLGAFNGTIPSQFLWAGSNSVNPMSLTSNSLFYYNQVLLPHLFSSGSRSLNMTDTNGCILRMGNGLWEAGAGGMDQSTQQHCS